MDKSRWKPVNYKWTDAGFFTSVLFVFLLQIFLLFTPVRETAFRTAYLSPLIIVMIVYLVMRLGFPRSAVLLLPLVFAVWYAFTRVLNGDWYLKQSSAEVYMILLSSVALYLAPFAADREKREKLFKGFAIVYCFIFSAIAWVAVVASLTGVPWVNPLDSGSILGFNQIYAEPYYRLNILGMHPNIGAIFFYTALALLFYLIFAFRRIWACLLCIIPAIGLFLAVCLTGSVSSIIAVSVMTGIVVFALMLNRGKRKKLRIPLAVAAMLIAAILVVLSYPLVIRGTTQIYEAINSRQTIEPEQIPTVQETPAATAAVEQTSTPDATPNAGQNPAKNTEQKSEQITEQNTEENMEQITEEPRVVFAQERMKTEILSSTMGSRFEIYSSAFLSIADRPVTLLVGELWQPAMDRSARMINYPLQNHLHNSFLQTLVVGGGISMLLILLFTVLLAVYGIRLFFCKEAPLRLKLLVLAPVGLLVHSMTEAILFVDTRLPNMLFFLLAGMTIACAMEYCPRKVKQSIKQ